MSKPRHFHIRGKPVTPIRLEATLNNGGKQTIYYDSDATNVDFCFEVYDAKGNLLRLTPQGNHMLHRIWLRRLTLSLAAGGRLRQTFDLAEHYRFPEPGLYAVRVFQEVGTRDRDGNPGGFDDRLGFDHPIRLQTKMLAFEVTRPPATTLPAKQLRATAPSAQALPDPPEPAVRTRSATHDGVCFEFSAPSRCVVGEAMPVQLRIRNEGTSRVTYTSGPDLELVILSVKTQDGKAVPTMEGYRDRVMYTIHRRTGSMRDRERVIAPRQEETYGYDLARCFQFTEPGLYLLQARFVGRIGDRPGVLCPLPAIAIEIVGPPASPTTAPTAP